MFSVEDSEPGVQENLTITKVMDEVNTKRKEKEVEREREVEGKKRMRLEREAREDVKGFIEWGMESGIYTHERYTDLNSASITSTSFTPDRSGSMTYRILKED